MAKRVSTRRIRKHRLYSYEEAGDRLYVTAPTVRSWRSQGLPVMAASKPHYILGEALIEFVARKQLKRTVKMGLGEMYCFGCKEPRSPLGAMVDYIPSDDVKGRLMGLCEVCERPLQRFASKLDLGKFDGIYDIVIKRGS